MTAIKLKSPLFERLSEEEFYQFCMDNRDQRIERDANHQITIMPPASTESGFANSELTMQLALWNREHRLGRTGDSSTGYTLPTGAMLSPDASWISHARWNSLSDQDRRGFAHVCPEFVVELVSPTDRLADLLNKMDVWLEAGARLAWLLVPATESVYVFAPGQPMRPSQGFDQELSGEPVLPGFVLQLRELRPQ